MYKLVASPYSFQIVRDGEIINRTEIGPLRGSDALYDEVRAVRHGLVEVFRLIQAMEHTRVAIYCSNKVQQALEGTIVIQSPRINEELQRSNDWLQLFKFTINPGPCVLGQNPAGIDTARPQALDGGQ